MSYHDTCDFDCDDKGVYIAGVGFEVTDDLGEIVLVEVSCERHYPELCEVRDPKAHMRFLKTLRLLEKEPT